MLTVLWHRMYNVTKFYMPRTKKESIINQSTDQKNCVESAAISSRMCKFVVLKLSLCPFFWRSNTSNRISMIELSLDRNKARVKMTEKWNKAAKNVSPISKSNDKLEIGYRSFNYKLSRKVSVFHRSTRV